jgi:hypothetical protein
MRVTERRAAGRSESAIVLTHVCTIRGLIYCIVILLDLRETLTDASL